MTNRGSKSNSKPSQGRGASVDPATKVAESRASDFDINITKARYQLNSLTLAQRIRAQVIQHSFKKDMFGLIVPPDAEPPVRRSHKKSRNGCTTCKERKLKVANLDPNKDVCQITRRTSATKLSQFVGLVFDVSPSSKLVIMTRQPPLGKASSEESDIWHQNPTSLSPAVLSIPLIVSVPPSPILNGIGKWRYQDL